MAQVEDSDTRDWRDKSLQEGHESYGNIMWSVPSGGNVACHGSYTLHNRYVEVTVYRGVVEHLLSKDWHHHHGPILLKFRMSLTQWARFISTPNMGDGVPCTLEWVNGERMAEPPLREILDKHREAHRRTHADNVRMVREMLGEAQALLASPRPTKTWVADLVACLGKIEQNLTVNAAWREQQFADFMEAQLDLAKAEIEAHLGAVLQRYPALADAPPSTLLLSGPEVGFPDPDEPTT